MQAVLFDMDGVLIDSQPAHYDADRQVLSEFGVFVERESLVPYAGTTTENRFALFQRDFGLKGDCAAFCARREALIGELFLEQEAPLVSGVKTLLQSLTDAGFLLAVASSTPLPAIRLILEKNGILHFFHAVASGEEVVSGKPAPDVFLLAAKKLGVSPQNCVVVEDSENGVLAAVRAGMRVIGYRNPETGCQELSQANALTDDFFTLDAAFFQKLLSE